MLSEQQFRELVRERGYQDLQTKEYPPNNDGDLHPHPFSVMLLVLEGEFALRFADGITHYRPGELCELDANVMHMERTGPTGAKIVLAKRQPDA